MSAEYRVIERCRVCGRSKFERVVDLGEMPLANALVPPERAGRPEPRYPLEALSCTDCGLVQLSIVVRPDILFGNYLYSSSASVPLVQHFEDLAGELGERYAPPRALVVEIGSNDGILLRPLAARGIRALGVEPAANLASTANAAGLETLNDFFGSGVARRIAHTHGPAAVVVGNNVLAHIDDLRDLVQGLDYLLAPDGVFVAEVPYLFDLLEHVEYDTIYHEHLSYFSLAPLERLFASEGMEIVDVRRLAIHGGSIRLTAARHGTRDCSPSVGELHTAEARAGGHTATAHARFAEAVRTSRDALRELIGRLRSGGHRVAALGATAKGNTLLNYCRLTATEISYVADSTPLKHGLFTPGAHIPIRPEATIREDQPDDVLLLAWNYADAIVERYRDYLVAGGRFIHPIPRARIIAS